MMNDKAEVRNLIVFRFRPRPLCVRIIIQVGIKSGHGEIVAKASMICKYANAAIFSGTVHFNKPANPRKLPLCDLCFCCVVFPVYCLLQYMLSYTLICCIMGRRETLFQLYCKLVH